MSECLVTYLRGVINDDSLERLGVLKIKFKITSSSQKGLQLYLFAPCTITANSAVEFYSDSTLIGTGTSHNVVTSGAYWIKPVSVDTYVTLDISEKDISVRWIGTSGNYECEDFSVVNGGSSLSVLNEFAVTEGSTINIDMFKNSPLEQLYIYNGRKTSGSLSSLRSSAIRVLMMNQQDGSGITGSLSDIINNTLPENLVSLGLTNAEKVTGDIGSLGDFNKLGILNLSGSAGITGSIESFLEGWYQGTKESIELVLPRNITLNGTALNSIGWVGSATKSNEVLTLKDGMNATRATYNGSVWSYTQ